MRGNYCGPADADGEGLASPSPRRSRLRSLRSCFLDISAGAAVASLPVGDALLSVAARLPGRFGRPPSIA